VWRRDVLHNYIQEMLLDLQTICQSDWHQDTLEGMAKLYHKGNSNYTTVIRRILNVEQLHQMFIDSI